MFEGLQPVLKSANSVNSYVRMLNANENILQNKAIMQTQRLLDSPTIRIAQEQAHYNEVMRKALGIDQMESMLKMSRSIERLQQNVTGNLSQVLSDGVINKLKPYSMPDSLLKTAEAALKSYRTYEEGLESRAISYFLYSSQIFSEIQDSEIEDIEANEDKEANAKILEEIFVPEKTSREITSDSPIIVLSPINDKVLKYLSENPESLYQLTGNDFEIVMAEIYSKLGYDVKRTKQTRDGGKDLIIRKPEILGDFIYYVECKKYAPKRHIGVGIVRNLVGTINTDRVNGGILATTSFFTKDARDFIMDENWSSQIKMHDYNKIRDLLDIVV